MPVADRRQKGNEMKLGVDVDGVTNVLTKHNRFANN